MTEKNGNERNESNAGPGVGRRLFLKTAGIGGVAAASGLAAPALATGAKRKVVFVAHEDIPFFAPVRAGFKEFGTLRDWDAQFFARGTPANVAETVRLQVDALNSKPDAVGFTRINETAFDENIMRAKDADIPVSSMSGGQRQAVAIARACASGGQLVIMDEPTAALGIREQRMVLDVVHDLRAHGTSVLIISHNLDHVFEVADDLLILRGGRVVAEVERNAVSHDEVVRLILAGQPRDADLEEEVAA
ncbi:ATP-binding cassette domain-containing protein [Sinorhizobium meliloti]|uniref:substrate-binding domain-containing protein n=1 Tax=Rhizobium meliloti TaxID=382 RepID=UPI000FD73AB6|nr:ATP-binding cassette domain-containing protein [Sinorhizobium meliloti]RVM36594.1 ATP-binding cassette domain-containing protein [Sinorhizobium meliloti]